METKDGGGCYVIVECENGGKKEYFGGKGGWNVCYVGGEQFLGDPRIGDFSVTFTKKDGEGEGLTNPVIKLANLNNWQRSIDVASERHRTYECAKKGECKKQCTKDLICDYSISWGNSNSRTKKWACGLPVLGSDVSSWL
jgi:hypothetical protein